MDRFNIFRKELIMKKYFILSFIYLILALIGGVFYREFTKAFEFTGKMTLSIVHVHFFVLGVVLFLIIAILNHLINLEQNKGFKVFLILYNISLPFIAVMFLTRGIIQVLDLSLSPAINSMISGIAGVSHFMLGGSLIFLFVLLIKSQKDKLTKIN